MVTEYRFLVDGNVGRLARWLRVMGYDTLFPPGSDDNDLVRIALRENRVLVTRDTGFSLRRSARQGLLRVVLLTSHDLNGQLCQLVREMDLDPQVWQHTGVTRCVIYNEPLLSVSKNEVVGRVPPYVYRNQLSFSECPGCQRLFWRGTH